MTRVNSHKTSRRSSYVVTVESSNYFVMNGNVGEVSSVTSKLGWFILMELICATVYESGRGPFLSMLHVCSWVCVAVCLFPLP